MTFDRFMGKAKDMAVKAKEITQDTARDVKDSAEHVWDISKERVQGSFDHLLCELNGLKPILKECGFLVGDMNVTLTVPPEVSMTVENTGKSQLTLEQMLAEKGDQLSQLQKMVIHSLIRANSMAQITRRYGYTFKKYDIDVTLPPKVTLHLIPVGHVED